MDVINVPAIVMVPLVVTGPPEVVSPVVPPETSTEVTVPPAAVDAIVMDPLPFVIVMFDPAVSVALLNVLPEELPIKSSPSAYDVCPVPPLATARVPARVSVPDVVIGPPEKLIPVVPPEASTEVTVPLLMASIVIEPVPLVTVMPVPAVKVAFVSVLPVVLPISNSPFMYEV